MVPFATQGSKSTLSLIILACNVYVHTHKHAIRGQHRPLVLTVLLGAVLGPSGHSESEGLACSISRASQYIVS